MRIGSLIITILTLLTSCATTTSYKKIGIDPSFYPLELPGQTQNVYAFTRDLLMEVSSHSNLDLAIYDTNWNSLTDELKEGKYEACITSIPQYKFEEKVYDFSDSYLPVGPVLIAQIDTKYTNLKSYSGKEVGYVAGSKHDLILEDESGVIIRPYPTIPTMLEAVRKGKIEGCVVPILLANQYTKKGYRDTLKITSDPLTDQSLRLVTKHGEQKKLISRFNKALHHLKKENIYNNLLQKHF